MSVAQPYMQAGLQRRDGIGLGRSARGLLLRGVVVQIYGFDAPAANSPDRQSPPAAQYADVLCYTGMRGGRYHFLPRCLITREYSGVHDGDIGTPRSFHHGFGKVAVATASINSKTSPVLIDGDHVLVGFIDDRMEQPVILRHLPHPRADTGKSPEAALGDRLRPVQGDGVPRAWKHQGVLVGISGDGDWVLNTRRAHLGFGGDGTAAGGGGYDPATGDEVASTLLGASTYAAAGNVSVQLPDNAVLAFDFPPAAGSSQDVGERFRILHRPGTQESQAELLADTVTIGSPADDVSQPLENAVLGASWGEARNTLNRDAYARISAILTGMLPLTSAAAALQTGLSGPPPAPPPATAPALVGLLTPYVAAVNAFLTTLTTQLSALALAIDAFERPTTGADPSVEEQNAYLSAHTFFSEAE